MKVFLIADRQESEVDRFDVSVLSGITVRRNRKLSQLVVRPSTPRFVAAASFNRASGRREGQRPSRF